MARVIPYNVRQLDNGKYTAYMPEHPYIGCPVIGSRKEAMTYIANSIGLNYPELRDALKNRRLVLHPHSRQPLLFAKR